MHTDDTNVSQPTSSEPDPDHQPAGEWTPDLRTGNWTPTDSARGYGRPDPEEFGHATIDQTPPPVHLIPDLIPLTLESEPVQFEEPTPDIGYPFIGTRHDTQFETPRPTDQPVSQIPGSITVTSDQRGRVSATIFTADADTISSDREPDSLSPEKGRAPEDAGVDLWPQTTLRDQATEPSAAPIGEHDQAAEHAHYDQVEPLSRFEPAHLPPSIDLELRSVSSELDQAQSLENGRDEPAIGGHSFETGQIDHSEQRGDQLEPAHQLLEGRTAEPPAHVSKTLDGPVTIASVEQPAQGPGTFIGSGEPVQAADPSDQHRHQSETGSALHLIDDQASRNPAGYFGTADTPQIDGLDAALGEEADDVDGELDAELEPPSIGPVHSAGELVAPTPQSRARSPKTEKQYDGRVRLIWKRSVEKRSTDPQQPEVVTPLEVTEDFIATRDSSSANTWNLYRAALLWYLAQRRDENEMYEQSYHLLATTHAEATSARTKPRGAAKKTISEDHLNQLIDTLGGMNRHVNWGSRTQFWLQAGLASGARPGEWVGASWLDETEKVLCIPNGKRKSTVPIYSIVSPGQTIHDVEADNPERLVPGSQFDESKRIRNVEIDPKERLWVNLHMGAMNGYLDKFPDEERDARFITYYNMCRKILRSACIKTFNGKRQYPLYCMRSQYAANMKAEMPLEDVSARMGHEMHGRTTMSSYGPRSAAHGGRGAPTPHELQNRTEAQKSRADDALAAGASVHRMDPEST